MQYPTFLLVTSIMFLLLWWDWIQALTCNIGTLQVGFHVNHLLIHSDTEMYCELLEIDVKSLCSVYLCLSSEQSYPFRSHCESGSTKPRPLSKPVSHFRNLFVQPLWQIELKLWRNMFSLRGPDRPEREGLKAACKLSVCKFGLGQAG